MDAKVIVQMDGKKTRIIRPKHTTIDNNNVNSAQNRDNFHDFTFDYSYWSFGDETEHNRIDGTQPQHIVTQEEVYNDLGMDVINCAFQGMNSTVCLHLSCFFKVFFVLFCCASLSSYYSCVCVYMCYTASKKQVKK